MENIYLITGKLVVWLIIGLITLFLIALLSLPFIWLGVRLHSFLTNDYCAYYFGRVIKTDVLRNAFKKINSSHKLYQTLLKYRLRNIKSNHRP